MIGLDGVTAGLPGRPYTALPVLPALAPLLPDRGVTKGTVLTVEGAGALSLALLAGASQTGEWCGVAGLPETGIAAAAAAGADPARIILVPQPGQQWAEVATVLLEACAVVLMRPPVRPPAPARRRLQAAAQHSGAVLVVAGVWDEAPLRLRVTQRHWEGIGDGYGRLRACRAEVTAEGRGAATRPRTQWLWLPGPDGTITAARPGNGTTGTGPHWRGMASGQRVLAAKGPPRSACLFPQVLLRVKSSVVVEGGTI